jgi:general secretion pathway protein A
VVNPLTHWGLERAPFDTALDPACFFPSEDHSEALSRLEYLAGQGGSQLGLLTGEIGCGKSLTRAVFASRCGAQRSVAQISSSHYSFPELLRAVLVQLEVPDPGSEASEYEVVGRFGEVVQTRGLPVVLLFDEAQELDRPGLVGIRALNNLGDGRFDLTVVLVGQPELRQKIQSLPQLDQRTGLRYHLRPLAVEEIDNYVSYRLRLAGHHGGELFSENAMTELAAASVGIPRQINRIARLAMALGAQQAAAGVEASHIQTVVRDLERQRSAGVA